MCQDIVYWFSIHVLINEHIGPVVSGPTPHGKL